MNVPALPAGRPLDGGMARIVGAVMIAVGCLALASWASGMYELTYLVHRTGTMKANVALAFILIGTSLWLLHSPGQRARNVARVCVLVIGGIALITLAEYASGWNAGIDEFLFRDNGPRPGFAHPGRMVPNAAIGLMLIALALWLMSETTGNARRPWFLACLGTLVSMIGLLAMLGYLAEFKAGYTWWDLTEMPLHTALLFVMFGATVLHIAWKKRGCVGGSGNASAWVLPAGWCCSSRWPPIPIAARQTWSMRRRG